MYLKCFLESGIFAQDSKDSESRTLFYFVTDPSPPPFLTRFLIFEHRSRELSRSYSNEFRRYYRWCV